MTCDAFQSATLTPACEQAWGTAQPANQPGKRLRHCMTRRPALRKALLIESFDYAGAATMFECKGHISREGLLAQKNTTGRDSCCNESKHMQAVFPQENSQNCLKRENLGTGRLHDIALKILPCSLSASMSGAVGCVPCRGFFCVPPSVRIMASGVVHRPQTR